MKGLGKGRGESSQASVVNIIMLQAMGRDNDTVPMAFSLNIAIVPGSFLVV